MDKNQISDRIVKTETVQFETESGAILLWAVINTTGGFPVVGTPLIFINSEPTEEDSHRAFQLSLVELIKHEGYAESLGNNFIEQSELEYDV